MVPGTFFLRGYTGGVSEMELFARLREAELPWGEECRLLRIGNRRIRLEGLDPHLAAVLGQRWGGFLEQPGPDEPWGVLQLLRWPDGGWLDWRPGEPYRVEAVNDTERRVVVSYNFALCAAETPQVWRAAINQATQEPRERILDNLLRYLTARMALALGGFALHAGGVLRGGRAWVFAGPSRSGKSAAVALSAPAASLGDDFAVVLPGRHSWLVPALPFDNSARIVHDPPRGLFPLAGIWRLHQSDRHAVERPAPAQAAASLLACTAFPWALPELADVLLEQVNRCVADGCFGHLEFRHDGGFWSALERCVASPSGSR